MSYNSIIPDKFCPSLECINGLWEERSRIFNLWLDAVDTLDTERCTVLSQLFNIINSAYVKSCEDQRKYVQQILEEARC